MESLCLPSQLFEPSTGMSTRMHRQCAFSTVPQIQLCNTCPPFRNFYATEGQRSLAGRSLYESEKSINGRTGKNTILSEPILDLLDQSRGRSTVALLHLLASRSVVLNTSEQVSNRLSKLRLENDHLHDLSDYAVLGDHIRIANELRLAIAGRFSPERGHHALHRQIALNKMDGILVLLLIPGHNLLRHRLPAVQMARSNGTGSPVFFRDLVYGAD